MEKLFPEFPPITPQQWKEKIVKDLKGIDFEQLVWKTPQGFNVNPFYTAEDISTSSAPLFSHSDWDICEQITVTDEKAANQRALKALTGGASGLSFYIHRKINTKDLLKDISLEHIYMQFFISNDALHVFDDLKSVYGKVNEHEGKLKCFVNIDPLSLFAFYGEWHENKEKDLSALDHMVHVPVNVSLYQEAGANTVNELAIGLAHLNEYLNYFSEGKLKAKKSLHFTFSVGSDFFTEIAKFRAIRKLVALIQREYKIDIPVHIHAQTSLINKSALDAYNNMLRTTTEAMSAAIGGCDSIAVLPFDEQIAMTSDFSARISRNQQHILKEESYLNKVADISSGSYYIETLTEKLAQHAWEQFKEIEKKGGFIACLENNFIQDLIHQNASMFEQQLKDGKMILVGVNKFQNPKETITSIPSSESISRGKIKLIKPIRFSESYEKEKATVNS